MSAPPIRPNYAGATIWCDSQPFSAEIEYGFEFTDLVARFPRPDLYRFFKESGSNYRGVI